jgi:hypothetical protein
MERTVTAWKKILAGKSILDMSERILQDLIAYPKNSPRRISDINQLSSAIAAIIELRKQS